jgi:hypothetical protein
MPARQAKSRSSARCAAAAMPCASFARACVHRSSRPISTARRRDPALLPDTEGIAVRVIQRAGAALPSLRTAAPGAVLVISDAALGAAEFATIYGIGASLSIIIWSNMPVKQYRGSAAEFRCQFPAGPVLVPGIPLPDGSAKSHARPCYRAIIRRWRGDFPLSYANFSLPAGKNRKLMRSPGTRTHR